MYYKYFPFKSFLTAYRVLYVASATIPAGYKD